MHLARWRDSKSVKVIEMHVCAPKPLVTMNGEGATILIRISGHDGECLTEHTMVYTR
jgi:hypothetical protein